ncbi:unnamed protein product [Musa textilis]
MGTLVGHVAPGFGFLVIGLWHLFNHIKLHSMHPHSYCSPPWFPTSRLRHLELYLIIFGSLASISMELVIGPEKHNPFDDDGTIPSNHLHNFEHASISLALLIYASFAIVFDRVKPRLRDEMTMLLAAAAFGQQLLMFHLHSADHMGMEGQYHWLLQTVIVVSLATTLLGVALPRSFLVSFVRSVSIAFQGLWFVVMGFMLWTPSLIPKGCFMNLEEGHMVARCHTDAALQPRQVPRQPPVQLVHGGHGRVLHAAALVPVQGLPRGAAIPASSQGGSSRGGGRRGLGVTEEVDGVWELRSNGQKAEIH